MLDQHLVTDDSKTSYFSVNSSEYLSKLKHFISKNIFYLDSKEEPIDNMAKNMNINKHHKDCTTVDLSELVPINNLDLNEGTHFSTRLSNGSEQLQETLKKFNIKILDHLQFRRHRCLETGASADVYLE
ncbi:20765_t:CDS:2, partial [Gigaspora rosea]